MSGQNPSFVAGGDVNPSRFVSLSSSADHTVTQSTANQRIQGISSEATKAAPIPSASTLAAASGDSLRVYGIGDVCLLEYGDTVTRGQRLKSDSVGRGVPMATTGILQNAGAIALESGVSGDKRPVQIILNAMPASVS